MESSFLKIRGLVRSTCVQMDRVTELAWLPVLKFDTGAGIRRILLVCRREVEDANIAVLERLVAAVQRRLQGARSARWHDVGVQRDQKLEPAAPIQPDAERPGECLAGRDQTIVRLIDPLADEIVSIAESHHSRGDIRHPVTRLIPPGTTDDINGSHRARATRLESSGRRQ